uniref:Fibronectin type-III domain-containing protein n=1 Tax=Amphimedon queenslandica TaxID=400682 RepID=A0A1X7TG33_AMPQE
MPCATAYYWYILIHWECQLMLPVGCIAMIGGVNYNQSVIIHAHSGLPNNVRGFILNATSVKVNWTNLSETKGYVIEYTTDWRCNQECSIN